MAKKLQKYLQDYLPKIKNHNPTLQSLSNDFSSKKKWMLPGCKHPKTPSFAVDHDQNVASDEDGGNKDEAATLADIDRFLFENFKSLYKENNDENMDNKEEDCKKGKDGQTYWDHPNVFASFESPRFTNPPPDVWRSHRCFRDPDSSSIVEEAQSSLTNTSQDMESSSTSTNTLNDSIFCSDIKGISKVNAPNEFSPTSSNATKNVMLPGDCIALLGYSPDPHHDFCQSMLKMVEARLQQRGKVDWDYLEELLFCYMNLNDKKSHKFILSAFVDLIVGLR